jgi:hypothetical protein
MDYDTVYKIMLATDDFNSLVDQKCAPEYISILKSLESGELPVRSIVNCLNYNTYDNWYYRMIITKRYNMWAAVDLQWTKTLAQELSGVKTLEVMAGAGWLAKALRHYGVIIDAVDSLAHKHRLVTDVITADALEFVQQHGHHYGALIVSWPTYNDAIIETIALAWGNEKPIYYIGEGMYGCTATDVFHTNFVVSRQWHIDSWDSIGDYLMKGYYINNLGDSEGEGNVCYN